MQGTMRPAVISIVLRPGLDAAAKKKKKRKTHEYIQKVIKVNVLRFNS